jgi:hypothetical protein
MKMSEKLWKKWKRKGILDLFLKIFNKFVGGWCNGNTTGSGPVKCRFDSCPASQKIFKKMWRSSLMGKPCADNTVRGSSILPSSTKILIGGIYEP